MFDSESEVTGPPSLEELKRTAHELMTELRIVVEQAWILAREGAEISRELGDLACVSGETARQTKTS